MNYYGPYPTIVDGADGAPVFVSRAWQDNQIVGELDLSFDDADQNESCTGDPHMILAYNLKRKNADVDRVEV